MDTSPRLYFRYVWCLFVVCCEICRGNLIATNVTGYGGYITVFTCSSPDISPGDHYKLRKGGTTIYMSSYDGATVGGKYNATAEVGKINLNILVTNISDAGEYTCSHDFTDASGTVSVAFKPEKVTATTSQQEHIRRLSVSAYKVFPREANISDVSCLRPDNTVAVFQRENQVVNTNNEEQYLYDIFWNGTTDKTLSGDVQCNITIVVIDTIVETIDVSFQGPSTTSSTTSTTSLSSTTTSTTTEPPLPSSTTSTPASISTTSTPIDVQTSGSFLSTTTPSTTDSDQSQIIIISLSSSIGRIAMLILVCVRNRKSTKSTGRVPTSRHKQTDRNTERVFYEDDRNKMVHQQRSNSPYSFDDYRLYAPRSYSNSRQEWRYMNPN